MFRFRCAACGEWHEGTPTFAADAPLNYYLIPGPDREERCRLSTDTCVIDDEFFFVRGCIEIPVIGVADPYVWGAWVSLSRKSFDEFVETFDAPNRSEFGPYFGWLSNSFRVYPEAQNLKTYVHIREPGLRPFIELEPTDHPLAIEQRTGITVERAAEIYAAYMHELPAER